MSYSCLGIVTSMLVFFDKLGLQPRARGPKMMMEVGVITAGIMIGLPLSVATFP